MIGEDPDPKKVYGPKGGHPIEEVVMTYTKPSPLSFMGINNMNAFHSSEDRFAAGIRGSKAALATEKFEKNFAFAIGTFGTGGTNLFASAGWVAFDTYMSYQDEETQEAVGKVQLAAMLFQMRKGNFSSLPKIGKKLDFVFGKATGRLHNIQRSTTMERQLNAIGIFDNEGGRNYLKAHLSEVFNDITNILSKESGFVTKESVLMGPSGGLKMQSVWNGDELITIKLMEK